MISTLIKDNLKLKVLNIEFGQNSSDPYLTKTLLQLNEAILEKKLIKLLIEN